MNKATIVRKSEMLQEQSCNSLGIQLLRISRSSWAWDDKWTWTNKLTKYSGFTHSLFFLLSHDNNLRSHAPLLTLSAPLPVPHRKDPAHGTLCFCTVASINQRSRNTVLSSSSSSSSFILICRSSLHFSFFCSFFVACAFSLSHSLRLMFGVRSA